MTREPVAIAGAVSGLIMAGLAMAVSLGWLRLDEAQMGSIQTFVVALVGFAVPVVAALVARRFVTPTAAPATPDGQPAILMPVAQAQAMGLDATQWTDDEPLPTGYGRKVQP